MIRKITKKLKIIFFHIQIGRLSEKEFVRLIFQLFEEYKNN